MFDHGHRPGKGTLTQGNSQAYDPKSLQTPGKQSRVEQQLGSAVHPTQTAKGATDIARSKHDDDGPMTARHESDGQIHIITIAGLRRLLHSKENRHAAEVLFNNPHAYIVFKSDQPIQMPKGWKCHAAVLFPSYQEFSAAKIPTSVDAVVYDNEHWDQTPRSEKEDPDFYAKQFGHLAHSKNLKFIAAPTREFFAADARYADIIDDQLQGREYHINRYLHALRHDIEIAHKENPDIKVIGQISSNVTRLDPTHQGTIQQAIQHAETDVIEGANPGNSHIPQADGFWGYLYQGHHPGSKRQHSVKAGIEILKDLAAREEDGTKI